MNNFNHDNKGMTNLLTFFVLFVILSGCASPTAITPITPITPTIIPPLPTETPMPPTHTSTPDPATIAQSFYKATNAGDIEAAMALVAEDVQCRGAVYLTGKQSYRSLVQADINDGGRGEISNLKVEGDKVTYNWEAYSEAGFFQARGTETLQIKDGLIVYCEVVVQ